MFKLNSNIYLAMPNFLVLNSEIQHHNSTQNHNPQTFKTTPPLGFPPTRE